jgi:hypothetical protein
MSQFLGIMMAMERPIVRFGDPGMVTGISSVPKTV